MAADDDSGQKKTCSQRCDEIRQAIWNDQKHEFLGRTGASWGEQISTSILIWYR